jgi:hypothetical protein
MTWLGIDTNKRELPQENTESLLFVYIYVAIGDPIINRGRVEMPLTLQHVMCLSQARSFKTT